MSQNENNPNQVIADADYAKRRIAHIDYRWKELYSLREQSLAFGIKYLFLTNSGGAVSYLAFLGTSVEMRDVSLNFFALGAFVLGLIFIGLYQAVQFQIADYLFEHYTADFKPFFTKPFDHAECTRLMERDDDRMNHVANHWPNYISYFLAYGSLGLFILGCGLAGCGLLLRNGL
ncbi:MAG: hypothetical protein COY40_03145 [Alphaproteobacteria bacterium CG_4_10_14_0_8_um_filter_53_9]|nr:MAG: hypothetical protein COY40_03145 [Alphaproteobacteria bacterium CG_4_10_14_0_8_um_filter_53_9]